MNSQLLYTCIYICIYACIVSIHFTSSHTTAILLKSLSALDPMTQPAMKISNDVLAQDVPNIREPMTVRTVGRKATITKEELFQAALNLIGPQKVLPL